MDMTHKVKKRGALWIICAAMAVFLLLTGIELIWSNYSLSVSRYTVRTEKVSAPIRIALLTDLHGREFGTDNGKLLQIIAAEQPDLIALVGDIFNGNADPDEIDRMCGFIERAAAIAPVYFGLGNHETDFIRTHDTDLLERIRQSGAVVLESEYLDVEINGTPLRIGGYMGYYRRPFMTTKDLAQQEREFVFANEFEATERLKILLNHVPTVWLDWNNLDSYPVDLVLSGHYHGGLIRIPILNQGLIAPNIGWFPPYTKGQFEGGKSTCILTTGLAGSKLPRFFNPPEIAVVDIIPQ